MNRENATRTLYEIGEEIAKELNLTHVEVKEMGCGIWDVGAIKMSDMLKKKYGEEMETISFRSDGDLERRSGKPQVELGYRFSNPKLSVFGSCENGRESLASIELSDMLPKEGGYEHTGEYFPCEYMAWGKEGYEMLGKLINMWEERNG